MRGRRRGRPNPRRNPIATATWPQVCAAARVQLAKPKEPGDELAVLLALGVLGLDRELTKLVGGATPTEEFSTDILAKIGGRAL